MNECLTFHESASCSHTQTKMLLVMRSKLTLYILNVFTLLNNSI